MAFRQPGEALAHSATLRPRPSAHGLKAFGGGSWDSPRIGKECLRQGGGSGLGPVTSVYRFIGLSAAGCSPLRSLPPRPPLEREGGGRPARGRGPDCPARGGAAVPRPLQRGLAESGFAADVATARWSSLRLGNIRDGDQRAVLGRAGRAPVWPSRQARGLPCSSGAAPPVRGWARAPRQSRGTGPQTGPSEGPAGCGLRRLAALILPSAASP